MIDNVVSIFSDFLDNDFDSYLDLIKNNSASFSRHRKVSVKQLFLQMLDRKGQSQWGDVMEFYKDINKKTDITEKGFYLARSKFNPEAIRVMGNDFIANVYDNYDDSMKKYKDCLLLAIDGSKVILPTTKENKKIFGFEKIKDNNNPATGLLSTLYDCLNHTYLDSIFGPLNSSERDFASKHIETYRSNYNNKAIFTFDRGYPGIRLIDQIINNDQYFLFRCSSSMFTTYFEKLTNEEDDQWIDVTYDRITTNKYRDDVRFRQHLMNTAFKIRFIKLTIDNPDGSQTTELLISNLPTESFSFSDTKELYHLRWKIETSYNRLKNRMKLEEFSGYKPVLIYQDIYADVWMYNLISLSIIEANEKAPLELKEANGEYDLKRNFNKAVGIMKKYFIQALIYPHTDASKRALKIIEDNIKNNIVWIKKGDRYYSRSTGVNRPSMSYKKTY